MDAAGFRRLVDLLGDVLERPTAERDALLVAACGGDAALLAEARSLLAQAQMTSLADVTRDLEQRIRHAGEEAVTAMRTPPPHVGPYRVIEVLGEGGMGVVYRAEQTSPIRREVAIKVIRGGLHGERAQARFDLERRALALMDHPCVAHIYDAGATGDGLPYLAMELVAGDPLTAYCDAHRLALDARIALFIDICNGVQHAHVRGVIHRDLKPSNILVADVDGRPAPRIIDFGIAKVAEDAVGEETMHTAHGTLIGTLEYMSPEQAVAGREPVDTRSDVYSLGIILYELLAGSLPFTSATLRGAGSLEARRILLDTDPPTPSRRVTASDERGSIAGARSTDERTLRRHLRGDLDWIVMRAIEKDPARRYQSAAALAEDLLRFRRHEPVEAAPPGRRYRAARFIQRHRVGVAAAIAVSLALIAGTTLATIGLVRARRAQVHAELQAKRATITSEFITDMLAQVRPEKSRGRVVTVREVLDETADQMEREEPFRDDPVVSAAVRHAIGESYQAIGEYQRAIPFFEAALALRREELGPDDDLVAQTLGRLGNVKWQIGDLAGSRECAQGVLEIRERTVGRHHEEYSAALQNLANTYADMGEYARADTLMRDALAVDREVLGSDSGDLAYTLNNLATILVDEQRYADAIPFHEESLALRRQHFGEPSAEVMVALSNLGYARALNGDDAGAEPLLRAAVAMGDSVYGPRHQRTAIARARLGIPLMRTGRAREAEQLIRGAIAIYVADSGERTWRVGDLRRWLGEALIAAGDERDGVAQLETAWSILAETQGADRPLARQTADLLEKRYALRGDADAAQLWKTRTLASTGP